MDPITGAILAAVTAGVTSGATEVAKKVIVDAYTALKAAIEKKFGQDSKIAEAVATVEEEPDFEPNQQALVGRVKQADADEDEELQKLAQELISALEKTAKGKKALNQYNIQITDSQIGVIGDDAHIEGGMHFGVDKK